MLDIGSLMAGMQAAPGLPLISKLLIAYLPWVVGTTLALLGVVATALIGFLLVGLGASNVVPILFTAAGRQPEMVPSYALAGVTTLAFLRRVRWPCGRWRRPSRWGPAARPGCGGVTVTRSLWGGVQLAPSVPVIGQQQPTPRRHAYNLRLLRDGRDLPNGLSRRVQRQSMSPATTARPSARPIQMPTPRRSKTNPST